MRILIQKGDDFTSGVGAGVTSVLLAMGHQVTEWNPLDKPAFDAFDENEPDIFLGECNGDEGWGNAVAKCLKERRGSIRFASLSHIRYAADTFLFRSGTYRPELACQISCLANVDKNTFDTLVVPLLDLNVKIVGNTRWDVPQYLGPISKSTLSDLYASATVTLVLNPFEHVYEILASGGFPISLQPTPREFSEDNLCQTATITGFIEMARIMVSQEMGRTRNIYVHAGRNIVYRQSTYWHRVAELFQERWEMKEESERVLKVYNETIQI